MKSTRKSGKIISKGCNFPPKFANPGTLPVDQSTSAYLASDDGDFRHGGLGVGVEQFGAVSDDAAVLLGRARQEARHVDKRHQRDAEGVTEPDEARRLHRRVDIQTACQRDDGRGQREHGSARSSQ